jgi:hypothetical protein
MGMFFPAFSALLLQIFVFKDSPLYFRTCKGKARGVLYSFFLLTILNGIIISRWHAVERSGYRVWRGIRLERLSLR